MRTNEKMHTAAGSHKEAQMAAAGQKEAKRAAAGRESVTEQIFGIRARICREICKYQEKYQGAEDLLEEKCLHCVLEEL